jgi:hypothetical protein
MGKVIPLESKNQRTKGNLISLSPWEFRKANWEGYHFIQMLKSQSAKLERRHQEVFRRSSADLRPLPSHFSLKGGMTYTIRAMYAHRENESEMRDIYYLTGLMDCMINQISPILRTDLLRAMYKKVLEMKEALNVHWYGPLDQVLFPIESQFYDEAHYRHSLNCSHSMKTLYHAIRNGTDEMFDILSLKYVFYCPGLGDDHGHRSRQ